uniref:GK19396 n=1 Tax=Drosophila willistoni TaxID=7260 RepID=B4MQ77_DROWI
MFYLLSGLLYSALVGFVSSGVIDCSRAPDMFAIKNCCKLPELNLTSFNKKCSKYVARITPCSFECVFNNTQSLNGTSLVLPKVEQLLQIALNGDQKVIDIYMNGFRECSMQEAEMLRSLKRRRMEVVDNCSPMAVTYAICAHRYVNINCPEGSWTNSQQCNEAKDYSINCNMPKGRKAT